MTQCLMFDDGLLICVVCLSIWGVYMHVVGVPFTARRVVNQTEQLDLRVITLTSWILMCGLGYAASHHAAIVHLHIPIPLVSPF